MPKIIFNSFDDKSIELDLTKTNEEKLKKEFNKFIDPLIEEVKKETKKDA